MYPSCIFIKCIKEIKGGEGEGRQEREREDRSRGGKRGVRERREEHWISEHKRVFILTGFLQ
jgi:hypothetical protein